MEVEGDNELGVGRGGERVVCLGFEIFAEDVVVVEFAIDNRVDAVGRGMEGLRACGGEVVDRQADVT